MKTENSADVLLRNSTYNTTKDANYDIVLLPWGATEPHNYHLSYLTDCYLSEAIAVDVALKARKESVNCMVLPSICMGAQNPGQFDYPFCIHTRQSTQYAILTDIVASLHRQGFRKLVIINGHGGNNFRGMVRDLAFEYPDFFIAVSEWFAIVPPASYFENPDDHAGELETSVMMHYYPEITHLQTAGTGEAKPFAINGLNKKVAWTPRVWNKTSVDTGVGNPLQANADKGKRYADAVTNALCSMLVELHEKELY